jgi:hypothetical protein
MNRIRRVYPVYFCAVVLTFGFVIVESQFRANVPVRMLILQAGQWFLSGVPLGFPKINSCFMVPINGGVFWTLRIEWAFYLLLPWLKWFAKGLRLAALFAICGFVLYLNWAIPHGHLPNALHWLTGATFVDSNRSSEYQRLWASRYPLVRLVRNESLYGWTPIEFGSLADYSSVPSATGQALELSGIEENRDPREMPNLVVIVVESWGIETDPNIANALTQPYLQPELLSQYRVVQGEVRFYGSTVAAEARELCGRKFGPQIESASSQDLQGCVPGRLAALGYSSVGLHGMDQEMFRRKIWYRSLGFQEEWFRDRFRQQELPDCPGAFVGTCDAAVADWMAHRLTTASDRPDFVYWMTLNSHLPVPIPSGTAPEPSCVLSPLPAQPPSFCSWYRLVANVHSSVARLALTKLSRPTIFVIVGDHAPPVSNSVLRNEFSDTDVPYVILLPKSIALRNQAARRENSGDSHIDR